MVISVKDILQAVENTEEFKSNPKLMEKLTTALVALEKASHEKHLTVREREYFLGYNIRLIDMLEHIKQYKLDWAEKILLIALICYSNSTGVYKGSMRNLSGITGISKTTVHKKLRIMAEKDLIKYMVNRTGITISLEKHTSKIKKIK